MYRVALLGKPNVGKSSLYNILTRQKTAIVSSRRNITRDVQTGVVKHRGGQYLLLDMGGLTDEKGLFLQEVRVKITQELKKVDLAIVLFDVDQIDREDYKVIQTIRKGHIPHLIVANKCDTDAKEMLMGDIYKMGVNEVVPISCKGIRNITELRERIWFKIEGLLPKDDSKGSQYSLWFDPKYEFTLSLIGKPNVGKSSLFNYLLGRNRTIVSNHSGTTRDAICDFLEYKGIKIRIIDTAGVRKKNTDKELVEEYSIGKSLGAITKCDISLLIVDATQGLSTQDKKITSVVNARNKALAIAVNKWDKMKGKVWVEYQKDIRIDFAKINHVPIIPISCESGKNITTLLNELIEIWRSTSFEWKTTEINNLLKRVQYDNPPKYHKGGRLKMYYANQVKTNPPVVQIFINKHKYMDESYTRYLQNAFIKEKQLKGTHLKLKFIEKENK